MDIFLAKILFDDTIGEQKMNELLTMKNPNGDTLLHLLVRHHKVKAFDIFLDNVSRVLINAVVTISNTDGYTPFHLAALYAGLEPYFFSKFLDCLNLTTIRNLSVSTVQNKSDSTPLHLFAQRDFVDSDSILLRKLIFKAFVVLPKIDILMLVFLVDEKRFSSKPNSEISLPMKINIFFINQLINPKRSM